MKKVIYAALAAALISGCNCQPNLGPNGTAVRAVISLEAGVKASCVLLQIRDGDNVVDSSKLERGDGVAELRVAVFHGTYPKTVTLAAQPLYGKAGCTNALPNGAFVTAPATFPDKALPVPEVLLSIKKPPATDDADGDGFVHLVGTAKGPDCNDADPTTFLGAAEVCLDPTDHDCNELAGCADPSCAGKPCSAGIARLGFTTSPQTVVVGSCSGAVTVQSQDSSGNASTTKTALALAIGVSPQSTAQIFSDASCTTALANPQINANENALTFFFTATTPPSLTLSVSAVNEPTISPASQNQTVNALPVATQLAFTTAAQTVKSQTCSAAATVALRDANNAAVAALAATPVSFTPNPSSGFTLFTDPACANAGGTATVAAGASSTSVYFKGTTAGPVALTATSGTLTSASQTETITPGNPAQLVFTTGPFTASASACSQLLVVELRDAAGNASPVAGAVSVALSATNGVSLFSDAACATGVTSATIAATTSSTTFYFKGSTPGPSTITATASGVPPATQVETINPAGAGALAIVSAPQTHAAGACSSAVNVQVRDLLGNDTVVTSPTTVNFAAAPSGMLFFSDAACSTAAGSVNIATGFGTASFFYKGQQSGQVMVTVSATGLNPDSQAQTINPAAASVLAFTSAAQSVPAGSCSAPVGIATRDGFGNTATVAGATSVTLSTNVAGLTFYSDAACASSTSTASVAAGASTATVFFKGASQQPAGTISVNATFFTGASQAATIQIGAATKLAFLSSPQSVTAGNCSSAVTLETEDLAGSPAPVANALTVNLAHNASSGFAFYSDATCSTSVTTATVGPSQSSATFYFRGTAAGPVTVSVSASGYSGANQNETITAGSGAKLQITSNPVTVASGACSGGVVVQLQDQFGNPTNAAANTPLTLSSNAAVALSFFDGAACSSASSVTIAAGSSTATFSFTATRAETILLNVAAVGLTAATQSATITGGPANHLTFSTNTQTLIAGQCSGKVTVTPQDAANNDSTFTSAGAIQLTVTPSTTPAFEFFSDPFCGTPTTQVAATAGGTSASFFFKGYRIPNYAVTATLSGFAPISQTENIAAAANAKLLFVNAPRTAVPSGGCSPSLDLVMADTYGNPSAVGSATGIGVSSVPAATFYSDSACTSVLSGFQINAGFATAPPMYMKGTVALGDVDVTATATGVANGLQRETVVVGPANKLVFTSSAVSTPAGVCSGLLTLERRDISDHPANDATAAVVNLSAAPGTVQFFAASDSTCATPLGAINIAGGTSAGAFRIVGTATSTPTITAASGGLLSAQQQETITPGVASRLLFGSGPLTTNAHVCSAALVVNAVDPVGTPTNVTADETVTVAVGSGPGAVATFSDATCTTPAATITIGTGTSSASFYFRGDVSGSYTATAAGSSLTDAPPQTGEKIDPAPPNHIRLTSTAAASIKAGTCSPAVTFVTEDAYNNLAPMTPAQGALTVTPSGPGFSFFSDPCATALPGGVVTVAVASSGGTFYFKPSTPIGAQTLTATPNLGFSPVTQGQNIIAGDPFRLVYGVIPAGATAGQCSAAMNVALRDSSGNTATAIANTVVTASGSPSGVSFFNNPACSNPPASTFTITTGGSTGLYYFKSDTANTYSLTVSSGALIPASTNETVNAGTPVRATIAPATLTLLASKCSAANTVSTFDSLNNPAGPTTVTMSASDPTVTFYSDATCATASTSVAIGAAGTGTYYFKAVKGTGSGPGYTLTAGGGTIVTVGTQTATITNTVRSGTCTIGNNNNSITCPFSPAVASAANTFFVFQATNNGGSSANNAADSDVRCVLAGTLDGLVCSRAGSNNNTAAIQYYLVEYPAGAGLTVQHVDPLCNAATGTQSVTLTSALTSLSDSFVLFSAQRNGSHGAGIPLSYREVRIVDTTHVEIRYGSAADPCGGGSGEQVSLQVVELANSTVTRGNLTAPLTTTAPTQWSMITPTLGSVADPTRSFLLYSWRLGNPQAGLCNQTLRGEMNTTTTLLFARGAGVNSGNCDASQIDDISVERVQLPANYLVVPVTQAIANNQSTSTSPAFTGGAVDPTRTVLFLGGQWAGGQSNGEMDSSGNSQTVTSRVRATLSATNNQLVLTRQGNSVPANYTAYVVQLAP